MSVHAFVDESMRGGYYMAVAVLMPGDLVTARKAISALVLPGQRRIHFYSERTSRRREILSTIRSLEPEVLIYDGSGHPDGHRARQACLEQIVDDLAERRAHRLIIERDDSLLMSDRTIIYNRVRRAGCADHLTYAHLRAREECLLAIPDAVAWCWTRGGWWRSAVRAMVASVREVLRATDTRSPAHPPSGRLPGSLRRASALRNSRVPRRLPGCKRRHCDGWISGEVAAVIQRSRTETSDVLARLTNLRIGESAAVVGVDGDPRAGRDPYDGAWQLSRAARERLARSARYQPPPREQLLRDYAECRGRISSSEGASLLRASLNTARTVLDDLVRQHCENRGRHGPNVSS